jgi:5-oxoprolinase (ATP-hydrolysing)
MLKPQYIVDALFGALGTLAASQSTMNNFTFGNADFQYYETICGGTGAGPNFSGTDAVHTHMTNSRITDPEILEAKFPVLLEEFSIRQGSGENGKFKGGNGVIRKFRFLKDMNVAILSSHRKLPRSGSKKECLVNVERTCLLEETAELLKLKDRLNLS